MGVGVDKKYYICMYIVIVVDVVKTAAATAVVTACTIRVAREVFPV